MLYQFNKEVTELSLGCKYTNPILDSAIRSDGRILGNVIETILDNEFDNLEFKNDNDYYDMDTPDKRTVEIRVVTSHANFEASSNAGKNRAGTSPEDTQHKLENVSDWIFVTNDQYPLLQLAHVTREDILNNERLQRNKTKQLTRKQFNGAFCNGTLSENESTKSRRSLHT